MIYYSLDNIEIENTSLEEHQLNLLISEIKKIFTQYQKKYSVENTFFDITKIKPLFSTIYGFEKEFIKNQHDYYYNKLSSFHCRKFEEMNEDEYVFLVSITVAIFLLVFPESSFKISYTVKISEE